MRPYRLALSLEVESDVEDPHEVVLRLQRMLGAQDTIRKSEFELTPLDVPEEERERHCLRGKSGYNP